MDVIKCVNGHYYDLSKYKECPYCLKKGSENSIAIDSFGNSEDKTIAKLVSISENGEHTVAITPNRQSHYSGVSADEVTVGILSKHRGQALVTGWLVCVEGREKGRDYRLGHGWNWIGRSYDNDVSIRDDLSIADRKHCAVVYDDKSNRFFAADGGQQLTYVNENLLENSFPLEPGDIISIGKSKFEFIPYCREGRKWN